jgi:hypothetical protein
MKHVLSTFLIETGLMTNRYGRTNAESGVDSIFHASPSSPLRYQTSEFIQSSPSWHTKDISIYHYLITFSPELWPRNTSVILAGYCEKSTNLLMSLVSLAPGTSIASFYICINNSFRSLLVEPHIMMHDDPHVAILEKSMLVRLYLGAVASFHVVCGNTLVAKANGGRLEHVIGPSPPYHYDYAMPSVILLSEINRLKRP